MKNKKSFFLSLSMSYITWKGTDNDQQLQLKYLYLLIIIDNKTYSQNNTFIRPVLKAQPF